MKTQLCKLMMIGVAGVLIGSCQKNETTPIVKSASTVDITVATSANNLVLDSTKASTTTAATLSWNAANYGAKVSVDYTLQADSATGTFANPTSVDLGSYVLSQSYTVLALNNLALSLGLKPGVASAIKFRVKSDVGSPDVPVVYSSVLTLNVTPYSEIIPPIYPVPANLFITGGATPGGWMAGGGVGVPVPSQQFTQIDYKSFGIILTLTAGQQYLFVPVNGDWSNKYATSNSNPAGTGSTFAPNALNNFNAPAATGVYEIIVDFVKGTYTVTAYNYPAPNNLFITGSATPGGWMAGGALPAGGVPVPSQQFTQLTNSEFTLTIALTGGSSNAFLMVPVNGDWSNKYATPLTNPLPTGGPFVYDAANNFPAPATSGTYTIDVNFITGLYTVTQ